MFERVSVSEIGFKIDPLTAVCGFAGVGGGTEYEAEERKPSAFLLVQSVRRLVWGYPLAEVRLALDSSSGYLHAAMRCPSERN